MPTLHKFLLSAFFAALAWSAVANADYFTWALEVAPGVLGVLVLALTYKKFRFTDLAYVFILAHCLVLFIGAKYTYAEMPLFNWLRDQLDWTRNNYDKVGHFMQGFVPAMIAREVFLRRNVVRGRGWLAFCVTSVCLAISALYEIIEWLVAAMVGDSADAFLGSQGYVWDTQSDMLCALLGACAMLALLSGPHDRAMARMSGNKV